MVGVAPRTQTPTGNALQVQIGPGDLISNLPVTILYDHHQIHEGETFRYEFYVNSLGSSSSKDIRLVVPTISPPDGVAMAARAPHFRFEVVASAQADVFIYEGTTFNANGSQRTPISEERNGTYTPQLQLWEDPTVNVIGTQIYRGLLLASKNQAGNPDTSVNEFVLKSNTSYDFRVTSQSNSNIVLIRFVWYEDLGV